MNVVLFIIFLSYCVCHNNFFFILILHIFAAHTLNERVRDRVRDSKQTKQAVLCSEQQHNKHAIFHLRHVWKENLPPHVLTMMT